MTKLKDMQLNLDKTRIKTEADIQVAERELRALTEDEKSDLGAIEAKLKAERGSASRLTHGLHQGPAGCARPVDSGAACQGEDRA